MFWLFCSSRHTAITVTSAISLLVGTSLGELAGGDPARFAALAACTALLVAALALVAWLFGAGSLVNFVSETVMVGFKTGVALYLASTQLPEALRLPRRARRLLGADADTSSRTCGETNPAALGLGVAALGLLVLGKRLLPESARGAVRGRGGHRRRSDARAGRARREAARRRAAGPAAIPGLPAVQRSDLNELLPLAMACFLLAAVETAAIGRMFARKHGYRLDSNQEFLALAGATSPPASGAASRSAAACRSRW